MGTLGKIRERTISKYVSNRTRHTTCDVPAYQVILSAVTLYKEINSEVI